MADLSESVKRDFGAVAKDVARTRTQTGAASDALHRAMLATADHAINGPVIGDTDEAIQSALFRLVDAWNEALEALVPNGDKFSMALSKSQRRDLLFKRSSAIRQVKGDAEALARIRYLHQMADQVDDYTLGAAYRTMAHNLTFEKRP